MTADSEKRLEEILAGKAFAPEIVRGVISEGRNEPVESVPINQCEWCQSFHHNNLTPIGIDNRMVCGECRRSGDLWECPNCSKLAKKPDNDYICGECRGY